MSEPKASWQEWEKRVEAWRRSGESAATFAGRHGWKKGTLVWWAGRGLARRRAGAEQAGLVGFVEVPREKREAPPGEEVCVILRNGRSLRVPCGTDPEYVRALATTLEA